MRAFSSLAHSLPPEMAHTLTIRALARGWVPDVRPRLPATPSVEAFGLTFRHCVGLAAGFDKNAEGLPGLARLGFAFVEVGTTTPLPQPGNPKPRLFRLSEDRAIINRLGFNNKGHAFVRHQLETLAPDIRQQMRIGVNIGKNKDQADAAADYVAGIHAFARLADYITVNISSPNTAGLRDLQQAQHLRPLLAAVQDARHGYSAPPPLLVKIAPDISTADLEAMAEVFLACRIDGMIISNTTIHRPDSLRSRHRQETGGLSGPPLAPLSLKTLKAAAGFGIPIVSVGGIARPEDVTERLTAGACLVQAYTGFIYRGADFVRYLLDTQAPVE